MLKHYILTSLRNIGRHRLFSAINILGLALGLASFLVIFLYVQDELRYDRHQEDSDRVYRVIEHYKKAGGGGANLPGALEGQIRGKIPQAEAIASFYRDMEVVFSHGDDKQFVEPALLFTEPEMLDILSLNLIAGDPDQALAGPFKILITPRMATKYFGEEEPVGKTLTTNHDQTYEVTGILEPLPEHSHLEIDFLASLSSIGQINPMAYSHWGFANSYFYIKLHEGANPDQAETLMNKLYVEKKGENYGQRAELQLQPLKKIYLHSSDLDYDMARHSNFKYVVGFSALALFILMIVGFNYMNLSTARMSLREKEIGMRKIIGASRGKIAFQFLGESFVVTLLAALLALLLTRLSLPWFNEIAGKTLALEPANNLIWLGFAGMILFMTLFAGSYPALLLSGTRPLAIMSGLGSAFTLKRKSRNNLNLRFRQALVFLQFAISIFLIIAAIVVYRQIHYIQNKNLGVNKEQVALIKNPYNDKMESRYEAFANQVKDYPEVRHISSTFSAPPHLINNYTRLHPAGQEDQSKQFGLISVNFDYFKAIGASIVEGRDFSRDYSTDAGEAVILNEAGARYLGSNKLIGRELKGFYDKKPKKVIGIVGDIHYLSMHKKMPPLAFFVSKSNYPPCYPEIVVKLNTSGMMPAVKKLKSAWDQVAPGWPFQLSFMDQKFNALYRSEYKIKRVLTLFTGMAIFLSLLGLFGLAAFSVDRKMKEIGIRKAMGAGTKNIGQLLSGEFSWWILVSNMVAWPAAYALMRGWLNNYVYKTELSWWIFVVGTLAAILVTGIILIYQTLRAGRINPAKILREE